MDGLIVLWIVFWILCGVVTGIVAASKGKDGFGWFLIGCILGVFGIVLIALLPSEIPVKVQVEGTRPGHQSHTDVSQISADSAFRQEGQGSRNSAPILQRTYDLRKWQVLKEVDEDIAGTASRIATLDVRLEYELAEKYLTLNDKTYLASLERQLTEKFAADRQQAKALAESLGEANAKSSLRQIEHYNELLAASGQCDPIQLVKVLSVEHYAGNWEMAKGGFKVYLANGKILLINGHFRRVFQSVGEVF